MNTVDKLANITTRLELLGQSADWITKETMHVDNSISQTATLMNVLTEEVQAQTYELVHELETLLSEMKSAGSFH